MENLQNETEWRCRQCGTLPGVKRGGRLHLKYKTAHQCRLASLCCLGHRKALRSSCESTGTFLLPQQPRVRHCRPLPWTPHVFQKWVSRLPTGEKNELLARLRMEDDGLLGLELQQRMHRELGTDGSSAAFQKQRRTVAELLASGEQIAEERRSVAEERAARDQAKREREVAKARKKRLDALSGKEPALWDEVERLIAAKQQKSCDRAIALLRDLRDLAARSDGSDFSFRLEALREEHRRKYKLVERLDEVARGDLGLSTGRRAR